MRSMPSVGAPRRARLETLFRRLTLLRLLLNEVRDRRHGAVERLIEGAVNPYGCRHPDGTNDGAAGYIAGDDRGRDRGRRFVERALLTGVNDRGDDQCEASGQEPGDGVSHAGSMISIIIG